MFMSGVIPLKSLTSTIKKDFCGEKKGRESAIHLVR